MMLLIHLDLKKGSLTREIKKEKDEVRKKELEKERQNLETYTERLDLIRKGKFTLVEGRGYRVGRNVQYGSSYIDIPLLKKRKILAAKDGRGNTVLSGKVSKDFVDLITKRFNSKKKYKGSSIEAFKLLNKLSDMPINKRSKTITVGFCRPTFYDDPRDLIDHLDLILGSVEAGNNNLKNEGIAVLDELLKIWAINGKGHGRIYKRFLI